MKIAYLALSILFLGFAVIAQADTGMMMGMGGGTGGGPPASSYLLNDTTGRLTDDTGNPLLSN